MKRPLRVVILSASFGGGHLGPATELASRLRRLGATVDVVDLIALCPVASGAVLRSAYRTMLGRAPGVWGSLFDSADGVTDHLPGLRLLVSAVARRVAVLLAGGVAGPADVVVSTYPFGGHVVAAIRRGGGARVPLVSYVTDPAVHGLWMMAGTDLYLAGWSVAGAQLLRLGAERVRVVQPPVRPEFRPVRSVAEQRAMRADWNLPSGPLALVLSGSWGVGDMTGTTSDLVSIEGVTPVVVCGRNGRLRRRLAGTAGAVVLDWVADMASLMRACNVVVLNSGGLSLAEAGACGLPVIHYRPLPGQGVANAAAAEQDGIAAWVRDQDGLAAAIALGVRRGAHPAVLAADPVAEILRVAGKRLAAEPGRVQVGSRVAARSAVVPLRAPVPVPVDAFANGLLRRPVAQRVPVGNRW